MSKTAAPATPSSAVVELPDADVQAMLRLGAGEEQALNELVDRWQQPLVNFFYRSLRDVEQAEDLTQVVFIRLYRAAPRYRPQAKFTTYLFHIARRLLINEYRRRQRKPLEAVDPTELSAVDDDTTARNVREIEEAFERALLDLPENHRTAILLLKQQELSYQEIAATMGASESAVKTWIFRARKALKLALETVV